MTNFKGRLILILSACILSIFYILPTFNVKIWPYKKINLGLDLQGGMHLVLEVESQKAVEDNITRLSQEISYMLLKEGIRGLGLHSTENNNKISLNVEEANLNQIKDLLKKEFSDLEIVNIKTDKKVSTLELVLSKDEEERIKKMAVDQALETIRNRIDAFGVSEPDIRIQGENRILIQLPGIKDTKSAKELIGKTALLEFKLVSESGNLQEGLQGRLPIGTEILYEVESETKQSSPLLVEKRALITGASLTDARVQIDGRNNTPYVSIKFDKKGAMLFERITGENIRKRLAIVLDNKVYSAPVIQDKIPGGSAIITGNFSMDEARILSIILRAGALPAPVKVLEERTVGPTLGYDSIKKGIISGIVGGLLVIIFVILYYETAGLIANLALILNMLFIIAGLACFQATLTLPGIAGIILTIGMAVDSNVLIYERIREELRIGKSLRSAIETGFDKATLTILDSNITTLIAAVVLFQFGSGPVKGFAVTLTLGVLASLFSALFVSKFIFDYLVYNLNVKSIRI